MELTMLYLLKGFNLHPIPKRKLVGQILRMISQAPVILFHNLKGRLKYAFLLPAAFFIATLFYGCNEDIIIIKQEDFDPPRFNWRSMDIYYHGFAGMWAQDTNTIFLLNNFHSSLYIVTGNNVNIHFVDNNYYLKGPHFYAINNPPVSGQVEQ
jgi:hypothetical protein